MIRRTNGANEMNRNMMTGQGGAGAACPQGGKGMTQAGKGIGAKTKAGAVLQKKAAFGRAGINQSAAAKGVAAPGAGKVAGVCKIGAAGGTGGAAKSITVAGKNSLAAGVKAGAAGKGALAVGAASVAGKGGAASAGISSASIIGKGAVVGAGMSWFPIFAVAGLAGLAIYTFMKKKSA
jgi:hypothetical protein